MLSATRLGAGRRQRSLNESTTEKIVGAFGRVGGYPSTHPTLPVAPMLAAATVFEAADAMGIKNPIHRQRVLKLFQSTRVAPAWLIANGYEFEHDLESALTGWSLETAGRFD